MLEKIMEKRNVNHLSRVQKNDLVNSRNILIITRQGTKIGEDNIESNNTTIQNHYYPNPKVQKWMVSDATEVFKSIAMQEDKVDQESSKINELLQLLSQEDDARRLIDLLNILKEWQQFDWPIKNVCKMNHMDKSNFDPQVNL